MNFKDVFFPPTIKMYVHDRRFRTQMYTQMYKEQNKNIIHTWENHC